MAITGMVHFNINCSDYDRSLRFYEALGFKEVWRVPERNTPEVAAAVGMPPYRVKGALLALEGTMPPVIIDLLAVARSARCEPAVSALVSLRHRARRADDERHGRRHGEGEGRRRALHFRARADAGELRFARALRVLQRPGRDGARIGREFEFPNVIRSASANGSVKAER